MTEQKQDPIEPGVPNVDDEALRRASDVGATGGGAQLHADVPRIPVSQLLDKNIDFLQVDFLDSVKREGSQFAVIRFRALEPIRARIKVEDTEEGGEAKVKVVKLAKGEEGSTATGSMRCVDQLKRPGVRFPFAGRVHEREEGKGYEIADPHA